MRLEGQSTATYCAVITENGELGLGLGDMDIHQQITEQRVRSSDCTLKRMYRHRYDLPIGLTV